MKKISIASIALLLTQACSDGYRQTTIDADMIQKLNIEIIKGRLNKEAWVKSPEDIARHLFPNVTHDGEHAHSYSISKETQLSNCMVTVTQEGVYSGERHSLYFRNQDNEWSISTMKVEMK